MNPLLKNAWGAMKKSRQLWRTTAGQDLIEYALLAGFVAVTAGAIMPDIVTNISTIFSKVKSIMDAAQTVGS